MDYVSDDLVNYEGLPASSFLGVPRNARLKRLQ